MPRLGMVIGVLLTWTVTAYAAPSHYEGTGSSGLGTSSNKLNGKVLEEQYGGIVTDQTITTVGQEFYRQYLALWREKPMTERYVIAIRERPSARWGNQVWVEYGQRRIFEAVLPPSRSNVNALSEQAVEISYKNVVDLEVQRLLFRDQDIGPDEM